MTFPRWMRELGKVYKEQGEAIFLEVPLSIFEKTMETIKSHNVRVVNAISGYDSGRDMELVYHFVHAGLVLSVKFRIERKKPLIPTVTGMFPSAMLFEQENHEMLGVKFEGNHQLGQVLLSGDSPKTPLNKDVKPSPDRGNTPQREGGKE